MANKLIFNQYFFTNGIEKTERKNVENLEDVVNSNIHTSRMIGFHNRFHQRIQRSHPIIRSFKKCPPEGEARFRHLPTTNGAGAQGCPKTATATSIQQRIDALNERYTNNEIGLQVLLDGLSTVVAKQHN